MANCVVIRELVSQDPTNYRFAISDSDIQNGMVVTLGKKKDGYRDVYESATPTKGTDELWLVTGVELVYSEKTKNYLPEHINEKNKPFRVERVTAGGIYAISSDGLTAGTSAETDFKVGSSAVATDGEGKLTIKASPAEGTDAVVGKVVDVYTRGGIKFVAIEFSRIQPVAAAE